MSVPRCATSSPSRAFLFWVCWARRQAPKAASCPRRRDRQAGPSLVVDAQSGEVLHQRDASARWYPASLTKLMTLYLLFEDLKAGKIQLTDQLAFSPHAYSQLPSKLVLPVGATISIEQAILALILRSANDVAVAVGERLSGSEPAFAQRMNATARRLGMTGSNFRNANGWKDPAQVTTARDMATLAIALMRDFPDRYHYFAQPDVMIRGARITRSVHFIEKYPGADGLKTGFLCSSGFNLVASAMRNGRRLVGVELVFRRSDLRDEAMIRLFDEAYAKKSAGSGRKLFQLPASSGSHARTVLDASECTPYRYDYPGNGAWVGTFLNLHQARAWRISRRRRGWSSSGNPGSAASGSWTLRQEIPALRHHRRRPRAGRGGEALRRLSGPAQVLRGQEAGRAGAPFAGQGVDLTRDLPGGLSPFRQSCHRAGMNWLTNFVRPKLRALVARKEAPENLWLKCPACEQMLFPRDLEANQQGCNHCNHHLRVRPLQRLPHLFDGGKYETHAVPRPIVDPLKFRDQKRYVDRLKEAQSQAGPGGDGIVVASGEMEASPPSWRSSISASWAARWAWRWARAW